MIRDIKKIWETKECKAASFGIGPENTLMMDCDEINFYDCHENAVVIDEFKREDVWPEGAEPCRDQKEVLKRVQEDLYKIFDSCQTDIQEFLATGCADFGEINDAPEAGTVKCTLSEYLRKAKKLEPIGLKKKEPKKDKNKYGPADLAKDFE